jgi:hypothetical protein
MQKHVLFLEAGYDCTLAVPVHRAKINIRSSRIFARRGNRTSAAGLSLRGGTLQEKKMRILAVIFGAAAAVAVAGPVSADPAAGRVQIAQAQDSGSQSGSGMSKSQQQGSSRTGASQQGSSDQRNSGNNAASRNSSGRQAATNNQMQGSSRTTMRERSGGARVSVHGRGRTAVGVRSAGGDDVIIHRRHARHYVYGEPSTTVIRKRRYTHYREPSREVIIHRRHAGVAGGGASTRTSVRSRGSTTVGAGGNRESVGAGNRQGSSGQGNAGTSGRGNAGSATQKNPSQGSSRGSSGSSGSNSSGGQ